MKSLTCPAVTKRLSGRPWLSQTARSLVFLPPFVRPIRRPRPLFRGHTGRGAVCLEIGRVDHDRLFFAVFGSQADHHPREDTCLAPTLPPAVKVLCGPYSLGTSRLRNPLRLTKIIPISTLLSSTRACHATAERKEKAWPSAHWSAKEGRSHHRSVFQAVNHAAQRKSMHPEPSIGQPRYCLFRGLWLPAQLQSRWHPKLHNLHLRSSS